MNELLLIDAMTGATIQTLAGVSAENSLSVSPHGDKVYYLDSGGVEIVTTNTGSITTELQNEPISYFFLSPKGNEIYLILEANHEVMSLPEGSTVGTYLSLGQVDTCSVRCDPYYWLAVSPDGETLYVGSNVGVIAVSTPGAAAPFLLVPDSYVGAVAVSPDGSALYVFSASSSYFQIVNAATGAVENTISTPGCFNGSIALDVSANYAYLGSGCGPVLPINLTTQTAEPAIPGTYGTALAVNPKGTYLLASADYGNSVAAVNTATGRQIGSIPIAANGIVFSPDGTKAWIAGVQSGISGVAVVDSSTLTITNFIAGGSGGGGESIAITPDGRFVYVGGGDVIYTPTLEVVGSLSAGPPIVIH
ncbi:MAG: YncE family protein [Bryobacteraceae bacterium]